MHTLKMYNHRKIKDLKEIPQGIQQRRLLKGGNSVRACFGHASSPQHNKKSLNIACSHGSM